MMNSLLLASVLVLGAAPEAAVFDSLSSNSMDAEFVDLDGDGDLDLVVAGEYAPNAVLEQTDAGFVAAAFPASTSDSEDIAIADFNGDGHL
ncbi:MAG: FG-GAP-like repeat-containing protein, partial [Pseudomonadota bacterium]